MKRFHILVGGLLTVIEVSSSAHAVTRYAKSDGAASGACLTWARACTLTHALTQAVEGEEIWAKTGTYAPFALENGVKIIGGFAGTETLASQSDPTANLTIVDGRETDQCVTNINDAPSAPAVLRGFTLRKGRDNEGGGMLLDNSAALIVQCIFENNSAENFGGAVTIRGAGSPQFINCIFRNNGLGATNPANTKGGGAVFVRSGTPTFTNCLFHNNKAWEGGVILTAFGTPTFTNCTMADNHSTVGHGGALFDPDGQVSLRNCIVWGNTSARGMGRADQISSGSGGTTDARHCDIQGGWIGTDNLDADPQFVNAAADEFQLRPTSPCKNTGDNSTDALPPDVGDLDWDANTVEPTPENLSRLPRTRLGSADMGAYEVQSEDE